MQRAGWCVGASRPLTVVLCLVLLLVPAVSSVLDALQGDDHGHTAHTSVALWVPSDPVEAVAFDEGQLPIVGDESDDDGSAEGHHHHGDVHDDAADTATGVRAALGTTAGPQVGSSSVPGDGDRSTSRPD